jgi:L-rhamnono-1,4-lactonase
MAPPIPIIDSHIHLYPEAELSTLAWHTPDHPLTGRHSLEEFHAAVTKTNTTATTAKTEGSGSPTPPPPLIKGFVFIETDRNNSSAKDWTAPLQEIAWLRRIVTGKPRPGEGHTAADAALCLAIVPWAPVALGPSQLEKYLVSAEEAAGPATWAKVKGFRYLLQDKPNGTALETNFIEGLKLLGRKGYVFDLGVDQHRRGRVQLEEAVDMIDRAHDGVEEEEDKVVFILSKKEPQSNICKKGFLHNIDTDIFFI